MAKKRIVKKKQIRQAAEYADKWLMRKQKQHVKRIEKAILSLQRDVINQLQRLHATNGRLEGPKVNLKIAQKIHARILRDFGTQFEPAAEAIIRDFDTVLRTVKRSYTYLDEVLEFTDVDVNALNALKEGYLDKWIELSGVKRAELTQAVYNHVVGRQEFSRLVDTVRRTIYNDTTAAGIPGRSLVQESRLYARDMLMNFHNETVITAADELEIKHYLYVGDIMSTTRPFCRRRAGKVYTKNQINSWTYSWAGKSGPAMTHRGGYNCRHHWQPIRPEWLDGEKQIDIGDWNIESREGG